MINSGFSENKPAAIVTLDGARLPWISINVSNRNYYLSDHYTVMVSLYADPLFNLDFWGTLASGEIKIYMGYPPFYETFTTLDLELIFTGLVDVINIDPVKGTVELTGRDYSALLIDKKITQTYVNQTASQIAIKFANENNLIPVVTPTTTPVGTYNIGYSQISNNLTEWDFLTFLAQQDNFNLYVINNELHFEPKPTLTTPPFVIFLESPTLLNPTPISNVESIQFGRTLTLAKDVEVKIRSNSQTTGKTFIEKATSKHIIGSLQSQKQTYVYSFPNLSVTQAKNKAIYLLGQITQHEFLLNFTMPPVFTLSKVTPISVIGSFSAFSQIYFIDSINRSFDAFGAKMSVEAKNHDTNTETV